VVTLVETVQLTEENKRALTFALAGFRAAKQRHQDASNRRSKQDAYISLAEAAWWICAIDEHLERLYGESYRTARQQDENGDVIVGIRWARDRHTHQLPVTLDDDPTPFFGGGKGIIDLNAGIRWRALAELPAVAPKYDSEGKKTAAYASRLAGHGTWKALELCDRWFTKLEQCPTCVL
jgi:hypothetical protein